MPVRLVMVSQTGTNSCNFGSKACISTRKELDVEIHEEIFWNDSTVLLRYIKNTTKQFKIFVAYRIPQIKANSDVLQ